jgi:putative tricarboxylic transport membrane protein
MAPEFIAALILALFGSFVIYESTKLALGSLRAPGPGLFPFLAGCFVTVISVIVLGLFSLRKAQPRREEWDGINWRKIALCFAALFAYSITLDSLGYLLGTFLLSAFLFLLMEKRGLLLILGVSGSISLGFYFLFKHMLFIQLPKGIIPF